MKKFNIQNWIKKQKTASKEKKQKLNEVPNPDPNKQLLLENPQINTRWGNMGFGSPGMNGYIGHLYICDPNGGNQITEIKFGAQTGESDANGDALQTWLHNSIYDTNSSWASYQTIGQKVPVWANYTDDGTQITGGNNFYGPGGSTGEAWWGAVSKLAITPQDVIHYCASTHGGPQTNIAGISGLDCSLLTDTPCGGLWSGKEDHNALLPQYPMNGCGAFTFACQSYFHTPAAQGQDVANDNCLGSGGVCDGSWYAFGCADPLGGAFNQNIQINGDNDGNWDTNTSSWLWSGGDPYGGYNGPNFTNGGSNYVWDSASGQYVTTTSVASNFTTAAGCVVNGQPSSQM